MLDAKNLLEKVDDELVVEIMEEHGSPCYGTTYDGKTGQKILWFKTICHDGNKPKLMHYCESRDYYCLTNCGRMTFYNLIMKIEHCGFYEAVKYIANKLGVNERENTPITAESRAMQSFLIKKRNQVLSSQSKKHSSQFSFSQLPTYPESYLTLFEENVYYKGWLNEGISPESMAKYGIRWYEGENHIIIPHYDPKNNLIGIRRRSLNPEDASNKYMPEIINGELCQHPLTMNLYGLNHNKNAIATTGQAIIVEAEKSVLLSDTYYGNNSVTVATCGFNISNQQIQLLEDAGARTVFLGFDKDYDLLKRSLYHNDRVASMGLQHYLARLEMLGNRLKNYFDVYYFIDLQSLLREKDSPFDEGKLLFEQLYNEPNLIHITENTKSLEARIDISLENFRVHNRGVN